MNNSQLRSRYWRILFFFINAILGFLFWESLLPRLGFKRWSQSTRSSRLEHLAAGFRALAIRMGGVMIKVGQFLSSRLDVMPEEIIKELSGLQDEVPPEDFDAIRTEAEDELGGKLEDQFEKFEFEPMAAASLGQVHRARLCVPNTDKPDFCNVVVKIQRPNIDQLIEVDLSALRQVGRWMQRYRPIAQRVNIPALIEEFSTTIHEEIDYLAEGKNAETFANNFNDDPYVHVPRVVWSHTTKKVLTLEDVFAIKITDYESITKANIDRSEVAKRLLDTYLRQIFEDGFFHADPHPGNLFITPINSTDQNGNPEWRLTFIDFGMVGHVREDIRQGLRELAIGVGTRDPNRMVHAYQILNMLIPSTDLRALEQAQGQLFDIFWGKSMNELQNIKPEQMFQFAERFRGLLMSMPFQLPQNLLNLVRTVSILSGMCTGLDPQFNLWAQLVPYATRLLSEEGGNVSTFKVVLDQVVEIAKILVSLPNQAQRVLSQIERGDLYVQMPQVSRQIARLERSVSRLAGSVLFASLLIGGVLLLNAGHLFYAGASIAFGVLFLVIIFFNTRPRHPDM
jgi:predicted unusual protein kinase regulating ubiquinone biosynthesis (AarF/ABC1/UbiB family)